MQPREFAAYHLAALEADEVRHNLILAILARLAADASPEIRHWTLGPPGQCAVQEPGWPIVIADLDAAQCRRLAEQTRDLDYPGVVGPGLTAKWFADRAVQHGI